MLTRREDRTIRRLIDAVDGVAGLPQLMGLCQARSEYALRVAARLAGVALSFPPDSEQRNGALAMARHLEELARFDHDIVRQFLSDGGSPETPAFVRDIISRPAAEPSPN